MTLSATLRRHLISASALAMLTAAPVAHTATPSAAPLPPAVDQALSHDILKELVEVNTTFDKGTAPAIELIVKRLKAAGFPDSDIHVVAPPAYPNKPNVVVRYHGSGPAKPILYIGHVDVVDAKAEDWTVPPFKLTEKDGWWYGRGTFDMKDEDAAMLDSLIRLRREGFKPSRDIIVAFTADEETGDDGSTNGVNYLINHRRDLVDAAFSINPDSGEGDLQNGKRIDLNLQTSEKTYLTFLMTVTNRGGHSSLPEPDNAIYRLARGLARLEQAPFPARTTPTTAAEFGRMAALQTGQTREDLLTVSKGGPGFDAAAARLSQDIAFNAQLRSTCVPTLLSAGPAENALPQRAQAWIQCRILPDETVDSTRKVLEAGAGDDQIKFTPVAMPAPNPESPLDPEVTRATTKVSESMWPGVAILPVMSVGASDSIYTRAAGIPSYGLGGMFSEMDDNRAHARDERISPTAFYEDVEFTYRLMKELSQ